MLGRAFVYALGAAGGEGVSNLLELIDKEMRVAMTLTGAKTIADITSIFLVKLPDERVGLINNFEDKFGQSLNLIRVNVIRNCLRQDFILNIMFLR